MSEPYPAYGRHVEGPFRSSFESSRIKFGHKVFIAVVAQPPDKLDRSRRGAATDR